MRIFFHRFKFKFRRELKKTVMESVEQGTPLKVIDDIVFKAMLGSDTEDSNEALRSLLSAPRRTRLSKASLPLFQTVEFIVRRNRSHLPVNAS
jgi:hypothetical protein